MRMDSDVKVKDYLEHVWKDGPGSVDLDVEITEPKGSQEELAKVRDVLGPGSHRLFRQQRSQSDECKKRYFQTERESSLSWRGDFRL